MIMASAPLVAGSGGYVPGMEVIESGGVTRVLATGDPGASTAARARIAPWNARVPADGGSGREDAVDSCWLHLHVPAGAIPKDGPSAGITMTTAGASLVTGRPVKANVGMTGEVTLQGRVLPIGGLKQKLLAAHRAGLTDVVIPAGNEPDLEDVPENVRDLLTVHPVNDVREVLELALT